MTEEYGNEMTLVIGNLMITCEQKKNHLEFSFMDDDETAIDFNSFLVMVDTIKAFKGYPTL